MATKKKSPPPRSGKGKTKARPQLPVSARGKNDISGESRKGMASKSSSRTTVSGPARRGNSGGENTGDALAAKLAATQQLAADMPYNMNKPLEHGELATQPQAGTDSYSFRSGSDRQHVNRNYSLRQSRRRQTAVGKQSNQSSTWTGSGSIPATKR